MAFSIAAHVTVDGVSAPDLADVIQQYRDAYWSIYGADANLDPDTQDGQWIGIVSQAIYDLNQTFKGVYFSFSPATAVGTGLSSVIKINGLQRESPTASVVTLSIVGPQNTVINNGVAGDAVGNRWDLPPVVTIPAAGTIDVVATCEALGAVTAGAGTVNRILTPTRGWQSVSNAAAATPGNPVEIDATVRRRQSRSTALPAQTVREGIYAALGNLPGVSRLEVYENDLAEPDARGILGHSIAAVVDGGVAQSIGDTIADKKAPGTGTYGNVLVNTQDEHGLPLKVYYTVLSQVTLTVEVDVTPLVGYTSLIGEQIRQALVDFVNSLGIGETSWLPRLYTPANLGGTTSAGTFVISAIRQSRAGPALPATVGAAYNEVLVTDLAHVTLAVV